MNHSNSEVKPTRNNDHEPADDKNRIHDIDEDM